MVNTKFNQIKTLNPTINKIVKEGRYDADDVTEAERLYVERHRATERAKSTVLPAGDIVVVLEGTHTGKKAIVIKQLDNFKVILAAFEASSHASIFKIDERYLLRVESHVDIPDFNLNAEDVYESMPDEGEKIDAEPSSDEKAVLNRLYEAISKVPYMKTYLAEPFKVDNSTEFYSLKY